MNFKLSYDEVLDGIIAVDPRFHHDAYHFVREGLDYTQQAISKQENGTVRHISGQELLGGMRAHAIEQYGPMAFTVLKEWGVKRCEDFGAIVFNMWSTSCWRRRRTIRWMTSPAATISRKPSANPSFPPSPPRPRGG